MGIALGYAFLVAIAGGLAAICFAQYLEMVEENDQPAQRDDDPTRERLLYGAPSIVPSERSLRRLPGSAPVRSGPRIALTSK